MKGINGDASGPHRRSGKDTMFRRYLLLALAAALLLHIGYLYYKVGRGGVPGTTGKSPPSSTFAPRRSVRGTPSETCASPSDCIDFPTGKSRESRPQPGGTPVIPGAMDAGLTTLLFWGSLIFSLILAGITAFPVNRWLIPRGQGHALVHRHHGQHPSPLSTTEQSPSSHRSGCHHMDHR